MHAPVLHEQCGAHRHQALRDLGAMATQILAAAEKRAGRQVDDEVVLRQYHPGSPGTDARRVPVGERPPAAQQVGFGGGTP